MRQAERVRKDVAHKAKRGGKCEKMQAGREARKHTPDPRRSALERK